RFSLLLQLFIKFPPLRQQWASKASWKVEDRLCSRRLLKLTLSISSKFAFSSTAKLPPPSISSALFPRRQSRQNGRRRRAVLRRLRHTSPADALLHHKDGSLRGAEEQMVKLVESGVMRDGLGTHAV
ncbi:unnamed protein product, partial [Brassica rapa subsp. narinosa]